VLAIGTMAPRLVVASLALGCLAAVAACGKSDALASDGSVGADAGAADGAPDADAMTGTEGDAAPAGWQVSDVIAAIVSLTDDAGDDASWMGFPKQYAFVLAWNPTTGDAYTLGGGAWSTSVVKPAADGKSFDGGPWTAGVPYATACGGQATVTLDQVTLVLSGGRISGSASGTATYVTSGATKLTAHLLASFLGQPHTTPPAFIAPDAGVDPLAGVDLEASEPLPEPAATALVGAPIDDTVPLSGAEIGLAGGGLHGLSETGRALHYSDAYSLQADEVTDFAGRSPSAAVTFSTGVAPPLVPQDGFESVTGTMFAGAGVLHGGPLMPIEGQTSLLLNTGFGGGFGFLPYDLGPSLAVRLALSPGDTVVRFDAQLIAPDPIDQASFVGDLRWGSEGGTVGAAENVDGSGFQLMALPDLGDIYVTAVKTVTLPLPADATGEITFEIIGQTFTCAAPPSPTVLVLDNLRVE
jgi:hypothetical protein